MLQVRNASHCQDKKCIASDAFQQALPSFVLMSWKRVAFRSGRNASLAMNFEMSRQRTSYNVQNVARYEDSNN